jgi:hypothetical protein
MVLAYYLSVLIGVELLCPPDFKNGWGIKIGISAKHCR